MSTNPRARRTNALADRIAGFDDPSMGDERERDVILRAYTFASTLSIYVFLGLGIVFAVIGAGMWSVLIVLASGVAGSAVSSYCRRENVDFTLAMARISPRRLVVSYVVGAIFAAAWLAAIVFHQTVGHPLIDVGLGSAAEAFSEDALPVVIGGIVGFAAAVVVMSISRFRKLRQVRAEAAAADEIEDED